MKPSSSKPDPNAHTYPTFCSPSSLTRTETAEKYEDAVRQMLKGFLDTQTELANLCKNASISAMQREAYRQKIYGLDHARSIAIEAIRAVNPYFEESLGLPVPAVQLGVARTETRRGLN